MVKIQILKKSCQKVVAMVTSNGMKKHLFPESPPYLTCGQNPLPPPPV